MSVNWGKDIDQTLTTAKEESRPPCWISARLQLEALVLGWMPSRMQIRGPPSSSMKIPSRRSSYQGTPGLVPPLWCSLDTDGPPAR
jgi:hypothetical protein